MNEPKRNTKDALQAYFKSIAVERDRRLAPKAAPIPGAIANEAVAVEGGVEHLWRFMLTHLPPDPTPDGIAQTIKCGAYQNSWDVFFYSEAFGLHDSALDGGKICQVEIDWYDYKPLCQK